MKSRTMPLGNTGKATRRTLLFLAILMVNTAACAADEFVFPEDSDAGSTEPVYRDRIIESGNLTPLPPDEDDPDTSDGLPRSVHVELIASDSQQAGQNTRETGIAVGGFWDTENWGSFSAEALAFHGDNDEEKWRGNATIWQRGLQMPGGWSVNNGLGVLNSPLPSLLREQYRFFLPSVPMLGASSEWLQRENGLQFQAFLGRGGVYGGSRLSGFEFGDGSIAGAGAQWTWSPNWTGAASVLATDGRIVPDNQGLPSFQNGRTNALLFANQWRGPSDSFTLNLQASDNGISNSNGAWLDARSDRGRYAHRYGFFYLEPELAWGAFPINNDARGAYYRLEYQRARWNWNTSLDLVDSISGNGFNGWYSNTFLRYQANPRLGYGGGLSMREADVSSASTHQFFVDTRSVLGQTRLQYDGANSNDGSDSWQFLIDHSLPLQEGRRLSLSAGYGEIADDDSQSTRTTTLSAYGGFDIGQNLSVDGTVRVIHGDGPDASRTVDANLAVRWRLTNRWSLLGNFSQIEGSRRSPFVLDPLTNQSTFQSLPNDHSVYLSLRYEFNAGRSKPVLGGASGSATGSLSGTIFLDENMDGIRSANELSAANITILLDDRYTIRTDEQGRFKFDRVSAGKHTVAIVPDNLPLPWFIDEEQTRRSVIVEVRENTNIDIAAKRQR